MSGAAGTARRLFRNAYLLLPLATLSWTGNAIAGKLAAGAIMPSTLTFWRWLVACTILLLVAWPHVVRDRHSIRRYWLRLLLMGAFGFTAFNIVMYAALVYTSAINVAIEQSCMPVAIMLGSYLVFRQPISMLQGFGVAVSIFGVLVTATQGEPMRLLDAGLNRGDALMMLAVAIYAGYTIALRSKPQMHWLSLLFAMALGALLASLPFVAFEALRHGLSVPRGGGWLIVLYVAIFPSLMSQLFFMRGVELLGANRAGAFINLVPIFGSVLAVLILGEAFRAYHLAGLIAVLGGIFVAERFSARPA